MSTFGVLDTGCRNCLVLRERVAELERRLGDDFGKGHVGMVSRAFDVSPSQARILLTIYYRDDWTPTLELEKHLDSATNAVQVHIWRIRKKIGREMLESHWGLGYRLTPTGRGRIMEVVS